MKKVFTSCLLLALAAGFAPAHATGLGNPPTKPAATKASDGPFVVGSNVVNLGVGLGNRYALVYSGSGASSTPALSVSYERGVKELGNFVLGVGLFAGYQGSSYDYSGFGVNYKQSTTDLIINLRGALHYAVSDKLDAYGGLGIGYRSLSFKSEPSSAIDLSVSGSSGVALFAGARYFFTDAIGAFAELGYDQTYLKAGLSFKF